MDDFSDQALAQFLQISPELANAIVSFQDLSDEGPEGTKVGVFVLQIGDAVCYVPVLGRGQTITPPDSLFVADAQQFFPLTKEVIQRFATSVGSAQGQLKRRPTSVDQNPNVQQLIQPPRTGKYVYASSSRFLEFLASTRPETREAFKRAIDSRPFAEKLFSVLDFGDVLSALSTPTPQPSQTETPAAPYILLTEDSRDIPMQYHSQIMRDGFAFMPTVDVPPIRVVVEDGGPQNTYSQLSTVDVGKGYPLVFTNGDVRIGFSPKRRAAFHQAPFVIFENGDYAMGNGFVTKGPHFDISNIFSEILMEKVAVPFAWLPAEATFALMADNKADLLGVFRLLSPMTVSAGSVSGRAMCYFTGQPVTIATAAARTMALGSVEDGLLLIPENATAIQLGENISDSLQVSVNAAIRQEQHRSFGILDSQITLSHDGVGFQAGGQYFPGMKELASVLVLGKGLDPDTAIHFIKKAQETKRPVKLLLKSAASLGNGSFPAGAIPDFGVSPPPQAISKLNAQRHPSQKMPLDEDGRIKTPLDIKKDNIGAAAELSDQEATEASVMAELLQSEPVDTIQEYLPEIAGAINRLGRLLFILRLNTADFIEDRPAAKISGIITKLKTVYKNLGNLYLQLGYLVR